MTASSSSSASSSRSRHTRHRTEEETHADLDSTFQRGLDADLDEVNDPPTGNNVMDDAMDEAGEQEDEITRCICGFQEYQGGDDDQTDTDGLFIQCDQCKVWQHGFCVGITDNESTPDNYYCEKCKPELHQEGHNKVGLKTSIYLPAQAELLKPSAKEITHKRRTTMNSRDAEYDDEVFKRMLEVSKQETKVNPDSSRASRGRKRGTSEDSDEPKESKRSRTSNSPESPTNAVTESSDEKPTKTSTAPASSRKARGTTTRIASTTSASKRTSARNRGTEKTEVRKEDSEHSDDYAPRKQHRATRNAAEDVNLPTVVPEPVPDTPQQSSKRPARNGNTNGGRRKNGRQTRQSEDPLDVPTPMSRVESTAGHAKLDSTVSVLEKPTKPRLPPSRMSFNEMKKRVNGISEYITRTQVEMANNQQSDIYAYLAWMEEKGTPVNKGSVATSKSVSNSTTPTIAIPNVLGDESTIPKIQINGSRNGTGKILEHASELLSGSINTGALTIMEELSTKINRWQQHYGKPFE